jgi:hypothetical protein
MARKITMEQKDIEEINKLVKELSDWKQSIDKFVAETNAELNKSVDDGK